MSRRSAARTLALDLLCAEVTSVFSRAGIDSLVLKGPGFSRLLYDAGELRGYTDIDLLVPPKDVDAAEQVLIGLGFVSHDEPLAFEGAEPHAVYLARAVDGMLIDLHHTIVGVGVRPERVWSLLSDGAEPLRVFATDIRVPCRAAQAFHAVAHAAQHGRGVSKPIEDLRRAVERLPASVWRDALAVAVELDAAESFAAGLMLVPEGEWLAAQLELASPRSVDVRLRASGVPTALGWMQFAQLRGPRAKVGFILQELAPPPSYMRVWDRRARRGPAMLALMYLWRPLWLVKQSLPALRALRGAKRAR